MSNSAQQETVETSSSVVRKLRQEIADLQKSNLKLRKRLAELGGADVFRNRYLGDIAATYDEKRSTSKMWLKEDAGVSAYLGRLGNGKTVLDVPVGTGRFVPLYRKYESQATGVDSSPDMLALAKAKSDEHGQAIDLSLGDVMDLKFADRQFDVVICIRLLNFFRADQLEVVISEIARVAREHVILTIRTQNESDEPLYAGDKNTIVHPEKSVLDLFSKFKLKVLDRTLVGVSGVGENRLMLLAKS